MDIPPFLLEVEGFRPLRLSDRLPADRRPHHGEKQTVLEAVWDTGRVPSSDSHLITWAGPELEPHTRYHWTVWDGKGTAGRESRVSRFETGFLGRSLLHA